MTRITGTSFGDWQRRARWPLAGAGLGTAAVAADSEEEDDDADRRIETARVARGGERQF
jgi:hypothetical protein